MSLVAHTIALVKGDSFEPPSPADFNLPPIGGGKEWDFLGQPMWLGVTKPMVMLVVAALLVFLFFRAAAAKRAMVPGRLQFVGELGYGFIRNTLGHQVIGKDFLKYVPLLFTLFFFILINNVFSIIPFIQFPTMSRIGYPFGLALITWLIYNGAGIRRHGFLGYLKLQTIPPGVPGWLLPLMMLLEFFSNIIVRPFTLLLRLFANMFAGHLLLLLFALGGEFMLLHADSLIAKPAGVITWIMFIAISFLEILVQFLQAFIFTILTSLYIGGAVADEH